MPRESDRLILRPPDSRAGFAQEFWSRGGRPCRPSPRGFVIRLVVSTFIAHGRYHITRPFGGTCPGPAAGIPKAVAKAAGFAGKNDSGRGKPERESIFRSADEPFGSP